MKNWEKKTLQMKTIFLFFLTQKDELSIGSKKDVWKWENPFVILSVKWNWDTSPGRERESVCVWMRLRKFQFLISNEF